MELFKGSLYDLSKDGHLSIAFEESWPRGILTPADRDFLVNKGERSQRAQDERRQQIRNRLRAGLVDISLIWTSIMNSGGFEYSDLATVFNPPHHSAIDPVLTGAIQDQTAMTFIGSKFLKRPYPIVDQLGISKAEWARREFEEELSGDALKSDFPQVSVEISDKTWSGSGKMESKADYLDNLVESGKLDEETIRQWLADRDGTN
jgi:hypothetical protein